MQKKWRMFQAMDFESLMYPCFISCRILGIFPYKFNGSTFVVSKSHYILSTVIVCVYCVFNSLLIRDIINSKCDFGSVIKNLQAMNCYMICGFIMIITHVLSGSRMRLLQTVFEISSNLSSESYQQMSRFIHVKDTLGVIFRFVQINVCFSKQEYEINYLFIIIVMFTIYISLVEYQINMLYINCVCVLKACFKRINDNLAHILMINNIKPCVSRFICHVQGNQFLLIKLKILMKQHLMTSNTVQMLNIIFSLQLLATIVMIFLSITFELYFYVVRWQDGVFFNLDKRFFDVLLTSTAYSILYITLLVWTCETGKNQAQEIGTTVHDLLNSINQEQIKNELQLFSLQILHSKNIFSAKGFTVDATLFARIVGNITTYLLILVQFLNMSHSCDEKPTIVQNDTQSN